MPQPKQLTEEEILKKKLKEERKLAFEAKRAEELKNKAKDDSKSKSKGDLKRERREIQEKQRAAKQGNQQQKETKTEDTIDFKISNDSNKILSFDNNLKEQFKDLKLEVSKNEKQPLINQKQSPDNKLSRSTKSSPISSNRKDHQFYAHIPKREQDLNELTKGLGYNNEIIHSSFIKIGLRMNQNLISDPTNRCIALLVSLKELIQDYKQPTTQSIKISTDLDDKLNKNVKFLERCRPLSVSMINVIRIMRNYILKLDKDTKLKEVKEYLLELIEKFIYEEIECGLNGIKEHGNLKINNNDVILTFGNSFLLKHIFKTAKDNNKKFRVIVVDSYPRLDGKQFIDFLNQLNIEVTYVLISALSYVMKEVSKVIIEAHTLLTNGYMISDMGSSQIALVAKSHNVPVLICCETYKFSDRAHTDSFILNEADSSKDFVNSLSENSNLRKLFDDDQQTEDKNTHLNILNLYYDITPRDFISLVITEMGFLPSTAVSAIIRRNISKFQLEELRI